MKKKASGSFKKVKVKVGRKLKKTSQTNTLIKTRRIVFGEQLAESQNPDRSYRGLSLDDLCRQLGHYNRNVRQDAVIGVKQLLTTSPHLMSSSLHVIIPSIARLISDERNDCLFRSQLKSLLNLLFQVPSDVMCSHFELLLAHTLLALTHLKLAVRIFGITIILRLMRRYPRLCSCKSDLFFSLIDVLSSSSKLSKKHLLIDIILTILDVYFTTNEKKSGPRFTASFSVDLKNCSRIDLTAIPADFQYSIFGSNGTREVSPLSTRTGVLKLCTVVFPLLESLLFDENCHFDEACAEIISRISQVVNGIREVGEHDDFEKQYLPTVSSYVALVRRNGNSLRLKEAVKGLV